MKQEVHSGFLFRNKISGNTDAIQKNMASVSGLGEIHGVAWGIFIKCRTKMSHVNLGFT